MKRATIYIFLFALVALAACIASVALALGRVGETAATLAAEELRRPPSSSEVIADSLARRIPEEKDGPGALAVIGFLSLIVLAVGGRMGWLHVKANYLRQNRLNTRANMHDRQARQAPNVPRAPRYMPGAPRDQGLISGGSDYDQEY